MTNATSDTSPAAVHAVTLSLEQVSTLLAQAAGVGNLGEFQKLLPVFIAAAKSQNHDSLAKQSLSIIGNFSRFNLDAAVSGISGLFDALLEIGGANLVGLTYASMTITDSVNKDLCAIWAEQYFTKVSKGDDRNHASATENMFSDLIRAEDFSNLHEAALDALTAREPYWVNRENFLNHLKRAICQGPERSRQQLVQYLLNQKKLDLGQILNGDTTRPFMRAVLRGKLPDRLYEYPKADLVSHLWLPAMVELANSDSLPFYLLVAYKKGAVSNEATHAALRTFIRTAPTFNPKPWHYRTLHSFLQMFKYDIDPQVLYCPETKHTALARKSWIAQTLRQRGLLKSVDEFTPHLVSYAKPVVIAVLSAVLGAAALFGVQRLISSSDVPAPQPQPTKQVVPAEHPPQSAVPTLPAALVRARQNTIVL